MNHLAHLPISKKKELRVPAVSADIEPLGKLLALVWREPDFTADECNGDACGKNTESDKSRTGQ